MREDSPSVLDLYEVASLGSDAATVKRALATLFKERKEQLITILANAKPDGMEYAKLAGRLQEWVEMERTFDLRAEEGKEAIKILKGGRA